MEAADRVINSIYFQAEQLGEFPELGYRYASLADRQVRILLHGRYRIGYLIRPDGNIDILGVFHAALDIERFL